LHFHKKSQKDGSGKCNIVVGGSGVYIAIFEISKSERKRLNRCEGLGHGYKQQEFRLGKFDICTTYVAVSESIDDSLAPIDWYKEYVIRGARFNEFPEEYVLNIERISAVPDSNMERASQEWDLIRKLRDGT
jgi:AIG2-like family